MDAIGALRYRCNVWIKKEPFRGLKAGKMRVGFSTFGFASIANKTEPCLIFATFTAIPNTRS